MQMVVYYTAEKINGKVDQCLYDVTIYLNIISQNKQGKID